MFLFLIVIQVIVSFLLITLILMQSGRGGGLVESFSGVESMLGAKTNVFLVRVTAILATLFLLNCLVLTYLSSQRSKSLMEGQDILQEEQETTEATEEQLEEEIQEPTEEVKQEDVQEELDNLEITESEEEIDKTESQ